MHRLRTRARSCDHLFHDDFDTFRGEGLGTKAHSNRQGPHVVGTGIRLAHVGKRCRQGTRGRLARRAHLCRLGRLGAPCAVEEQRPGIARNPSRSVHAADEPTAIGSPGATLLVAAAGRRVEDAFGPSPIPTTPYASTYSSSGASSIPARRAARGGSARHSVQCDNIEPFSFYCPRIVDDLRTHLRRRDELRDRSSFHKALLQALADPYTSSGRETQKRVQKTLRDGYDTAEQSRVLDARFELGKRNEAYLAAPVLPLQPAEGDDSMELGLALDPELQAAQRRGTLLAIEERLEDATEEAVAALSASLRIVGYLLTLSDVAAFCKAVLDGQQAAASARARRGRRVVATS